MMYKGCFVTEFVPGFAVRRQDVTYHKLQARCSTVKASMNSDEPVHMSISRRALLRGASVLAAGNLIGGPVLAEAASKQTFSDDSFSTAAPTVFETSLKHQSVLYELASGSFLPLSALPRVLGKNLGGSVYDRCVILGEIHDEVQSHAAQLATIEHALRLSDRRPLVVAFEQFYRQHNPILDRFIDGHISLDTMLKRTEWDKTWGYDPALYTPIFRFCRMNRIKMIGLNIPSQVVSMISNVGIDGLPPRLRELLPADMDLSNEEHRQHFMKAIGFDASAGTVPSHPGAAERMDNWYEAQTLWDEYMSQSISDALEFDESVRVIALVGSGHVDTRTAIPDRVQRRTGEKPFSIVTRPVGWSSVSGISMPLIEGPERCADIIWYTSRRQDLA